MAQSKASSHEKFFLAEGAREDGYEFSEDELSEDWEGASILEVQILRKFVVKTTRITALEEVK